MLIPWGSDAPLYHRPYATITLIVLNVVSFLLFPPGQYKEWTLILGDDLRPLQWLTNIFMHAGWGQLIGNTIFLWTFGISGNHGDSEEFYDPIFPSMEFRLSAGNRQKLGV